ncbi:MAG TPA: DUF2254 family protein [Anaeromyxobacter sp.]|nr:DUF2254 family protein [Anaeromyxobacter sp.]
MRDLEKLHRADIGLKALSPSMNDETTAVTAVNQLAAVLSAAARGGDGAAWMRYRLDGRTVITPGLTFRRAVEDGFAGLIRFSGDHPRVLARIVEVIGQLLPKLPAGDGREALRDAARWVERALADAELAGHERRLVAVRLEALDRQQERARVDGPHAMH